MSQITNEKSFVLMIFYKKGKCRVEKDELKEIILEIVGVISVMI